MTWDDEEDSKVVKFLNEVDTECILKLTKPIESKVEYLAEILGKDCLDPESLRESMIYAVRFYEGTEMARNNADFVRKCTTENLTEITGTGNIVKMVRLIDLSHSIGREIIVTVNKVCFTK